MNKKNWNGLLLVDKPCGLSSHDVVARLRRILGTKAVGHSGTLDPLASGLMVCLINEGTKLSQYILEGDKAYRVRLQLGLRTDTLDITGEVLETKPVQVKGAQILQAADALQGEMNVEVPAYSAKKVQGKKLYEYARQDEAVEIPKKVMKFWGVKACEVGTDFAEFEITCSKGSYIRTWVDLLGQNLGCGATMTALRRTWSAPYFLDQARTLEDLERADDKNEAAFVSMQNALPQVKRIRVKGQDRVLLSNGQISHDLRSQLITLFKPHEDQYIQIQNLEDGQLLALVGVDPQRGFSIKRVFREAP